MSVYESAPDKFNFSQSWGWKSSTLMLDDGMMSDEGETMQAWKERVLKPSFGVTLTVEEVSLKLIRR